MLMRRWERARQGDGQLVLIVGRLDWAQSETGKRLRGHHRLSACIPLRRLRHAPRASDCPCFMTFETDCHQPNRDCPATETRSAPAPRCGWRSRYHACSR
jgi:hypothetical protein